MITANDPIMDNYYALLLAIIYPYSLTSDEALYAIKYGVNPLVVTEQTLLEALEMSGKPREPHSFYEDLGRRYEVIRMLADIILETNTAMQTFRDYELEKYREGVVNYMKYLRERMEKNRVR